MLDETDWKVLQALQENPRLPFVELGRLVGFTAPAVAERVRKLDEAGVIAGYHAVLKPAEIGLPIQVSIQLGMVQGRSKEVARIIQDMPEVLECCNVTGQDCYVIKAVVPDMQGLQTLIEFFSEMGRTTTSIILSTPVPRRTLDLEAIRQHLAGLGQK